MLAITSDAIAQLATAAILATTTAIGVVFAKKASNRSSESARALDVPPINGGGQMSAGVVLARLEAEMKVMNVKLDVAATAASMASVKADDVKMMFVEHRGQHAGLIARLDQQQKDISDGR